MWKGLGIGIAIGVVTGFLAGGFFAAIGLGVVFGFVGWVIGLIVDPPARRPAPAPRRSPGEDRTAALEARVAALESRLARFEDVPREPIPEPMLEPIGEVAAIPPPLPPESPPESPPPIPAKPNPVIAWLTGGNAIARVGVVVLFIGIAFLLRYAVEHSLISAEMRVAGIGAGGLALLVLGWRWRHARPGYALSLQGAGVGLLYFAVFGAFRLYQLIPAQVAFPLLVAIAALATWLAIRQDSVVLAAFGTAGGFAAPVLASTGQGDHVVLFSYYAVLNVAVLVTAWFRSWRVLNLLGFAFTFIVGLAWGERYYAPQYFATTEPFLVFHFLLYVAVAVLFARREATVAGRRVDTTLIFGVPLVGFGLQAALMQDSEYGLAVSSALVAVFYLALAFALRARGRESWTLLAQSFFALAIGFATAAIPLAFDARWTSAAWAVEGAAVVWIGVRQRRPWAQIFGVLLQVAAGFAFVMAFDTIPVTMPIANGAWLGSFLLAASGLVSHFQLRAERPVVASCLFLWALVWWLTGAYWEIDEFVPDAYMVAADIAVVAATVLGLAFFHRAGAWRHAAWPSAAMLPALVFFLSAPLVDASHPFAGGGWLAWPFALAAHLWARRLIEGALGGNRSGWTEFQHWGFLLLVAIIGSWEFHWQVIDSGWRRSGWASVSLVVVPALLLVAVSERFFQRRWPVIVHAAAYQRTGAFPLAIALWLWVFFANAVHNGRSDPLPYLPLLNGVDLAHALALVAAAFWLKGLERRGLERPAVLRGNGLYLAGGLAAFAWANGILLRSLHHWADVPYRLESWMRSFLVQASLSIFWSLLALGLMVFATRRARRGLWLVGAGLMGVVVVKLMLVDLARLGGVERIVSFIGVGLLMLVIGYLSPVPPRGKSGSE